MKKKKCPLCSKGKARRKCRRNNDELICSKCCAESRDTTCEGCQYFDQANQYEAIKNQKKKHFIIEINEELEDTIDKALALIERGKIREGEEILQKLMILHPEYYMLNYAMGVVHGMKDEHDQAIDFFTKATDAFPYLQEAHFNKGEAYRRKLDIYNAVNSFRDVIEIGDPQDETVVRAREFISEVESQIMETNGISLDRYFEAHEVFENAFSLMEKKEWQKAIVAFLKCIQLNKNHPQSYGNLGLCYGKVGQKENAINAFNKALEIDPDYEPAMVNKTIFESLKDGEQLDQGSFESIDYYKDYSMKKKSYAKDILKEVIDK